MPAPSSDYLTTLISCKTMPGSSRNTLRRCLPFMDDGTAMRRAA